ncbi:DUF1931 family protein [Nonomuraea sp. NPDC050404]|uniref:DUF1931 family protein n=1 Tax=Nonomuraea sp. NPDC050404 TaxID=3155783 RepID=UPI0033EA26E3
MWTSPTAGSVAQRRSRGPATAVAGGLSVALARAIRAMEPDRKNPASKEWTRTIRVFELLL